MIRWRIDFATWLMLLVVSGVSEVSAVDAADASSKSGKLRIGAFAANITPIQFPVIVNGMFEERSANRDVDPLFARAFVFDDGATRIAIVVVDSCMLPRELLDEAKERA